MSELDLESLLESARMISATAIFACFALRNAAAGEGALPPSWRQDLKEVAEKVIGTSLPHLERDWYEEQKRYDG